MDSVKIDDTLNDINYVFECKNWLKNDAAEDVTKRTLYVTSKNKIPPHKDVSQSASAYSTESARSDEKHEYKEDRISEVTEPLSGTKEDPMDSSRPSTKLSKVLDSEYRTGLPESVNLSDRRKVYSSTEDEEEETKPPLPRNSSNASLKKRVDSRASSSSKKSLPKKVETKVAKSGKMNDSLSSSSTSLSDSASARDSDLSDSTSRTMTPISNRDALEFEGLTNHIRLGEVDKIKEKLKEMPELAKRKDHMDQSLAVLAAIRGNNDMLRAVIEADRTLPHQPSGTSKKFFGNFF